MRYVPKEHTENVNISKTSPLREFGFLTVSILGICFVAYFVLGFAAEQIIAAYPDKLETQLASLFGEQFRDKEPSQDEKRIQKILDRLTAHLNDGRDYRVYIKTNDTPNALAYPGGNIVVHSGLLSRMSSENELAMVLGHELGHYAHRDHLRGLGRGLVLVFLTSIVFGTDSSLSDLSVGTLNVLQNHYSQKQESRADTFGVEVLHRAYGHVGGATDFFKTLEKMKLDLGMFNFLSTHPLNSKRIRDIEEHIEKKSYPVKPLTPIK